MSNIIIQKRERVAGNLIKASDYKKALLELPEVSEGLSEVEFKVADSAILREKGGAVVVSRKPIKALSQEELMKEIKETLPFIIRDLGIKNWGAEEMQYDAARFMKLLIDWYGDLTYKEVEISFEMLLSGNLDEFLPKRADKEPDRNHYQSFSIQFCSKVLLAFKAYKQRLWFKAHQLRPEKEVEISEDQKKENRAFIVQDITDKFNAYKANKDDFPKFLSWFVVMDVLIDFGLVKNYPEITNKDKEKGLLSALSNRLTAPNDKSEIKRDNEEGRENDRVKIQSQKIAIIRDVMRVFDELIESGIDIKDAL